MKKKNNTMHKFRGGVRMGAIGNTWPFGILEVNEKSLLLKDELLRKEIELMKDEICRIEIIKVLPIIGYGIRFFSNKSNLNDYYSFGYWSFKFDILIDTLKKQGYGHLLKKGSLNSAI